jgi:serine/threonine protein kinase
MKQDRQDPFERWPHLDTLFERVLEVPPSERAAVLDEVCSGDTGLRKELESLLVAYDSSADFLDDAEVWLGERPALPRPPLGDVPPDPRIGTTISHYEVIERLGEGGMGVVYRARDRRLDRTVTLKFIQPLLGADLQAKTRFIQEARAASALDHPNICTIYEIDETADGRLFIAMAYYAGETLAKRLESGPLPLEQAYDIATAIGNGLARAHEAGIVHRDLKPANVMLTDRGEVRILDFGIAKLEGQDHTRTGARLGTAAYMSPEQAGGRHVDRRTDVWALGALLYEMVSGRRPFGRDNEQATIYAILNESPEPDRTHRLRGARLDPDHRSAEPHRRRDLRSVSQQRDRRRSPAVAVRECLPAFARAGDAGSNGQTGRGSTGRGAGQ